MPICKKCNNQFPNRVEIEGKIRFLNKRKYCTNCSPFNEGNNRKIHLFNLSVKSKICPKCNTEKQSSDFYRSRHTDCLVAYCKSCTKNQVKERQQQLKKMSVEYKGGCCVYCKYSKCISALEFHHLDPKKKDFNISKSRQTSFDKIKKELEKCILVCSNCHREIHAGLLKTSPVGLEPTTFSLEG